MQPLTHAFYVYSSYGVSALALALIVAWVVLDSRARKRELKMLEDAGIRRRSAQTHEKNAHD